MEIPGSSAAVVIGLLVLTLVVAPVREPPDIRRYPRTRNL